METIREKILHEDDSGKKVILCEEPDDGKPWVRYERYPERRYAYLTRREAAELVLQGEEISQCYIEALDEDGFTQACLEPSVPRVREDAESNRLVVPSGLRIRGCLIGRINLFQIQFEGPVFFSGGPAAVEEGEYTTEVFGGVPSNWLLSGLPADVVRATAKEPRALFCDVLFCETADFRRVVFHCPVDFTDAEFRSGASFDRAAFLKKLNMTSARFEGEASFRRCMFLDDVNFSDIEAEDIFDVFGACFAGSALFRNAKFQGEVGLVETTFLSEGDFQDASFAKASNVRKTNARVLSLRNAIFQESLDLTRAGAEHVLLDGLRCWDLYLMRQFSPGELEDDRKRVDCRKERLRKGEEALQRQQEARTLLDDLQRKRERCYLEQEEARLQRIQDLGRPFEKISLGDVVVREAFRAPFDLFFKKEGRRRARPAITGDPCSLASWQWAARQYRWLKEQYRKQGEYQDEDEAHWWASECARRATRHSRRGLWWFALAPAVALPSLVVGEAVAGVPLAALALIVASCLAFPRFGKWLVFREVFGYGVRPWKVLRAIAIVIVLFSVLFATAASTGQIRPTRAAPGQSAFASAIFNGFYFSVITFATVGYGDVSATGWAASCAMIEGMLGVVLNAALVVVIFRKLVR